MNPADAKANFAKLEKEIGPRAEIYVSLSFASREEPLSATIYPAGMGDSGRDLTFHIYAHSFEQLLAAVREKWGEHAERHRKQLVNKLALAVIDITRRLGACTDAALRGAGFAPEDIATHGGAACVEANEMAGCGPFSIAAAAASNGAPADAADGRTLQ